jgi:hypothetical protein
MQLNGRLINAEDAENAEDRREEQFERVTKR